MAMLSRQGKFLSRILPVFVWLAAIGAVTFLFIRQSEQTVLRGIAFSHEQTINSVETGYIRSIHVKLYQKVKQGDTLAVIKENTIAREEYVQTLLQKQRATAEAELQQLKSSLVAEEDKLLLETRKHNTDIEAMERRLAIDLERARLETLEIRSQLEPDRLELKDLAVEINIIKKLVAEEAAQDYELQKAQAQYEVVKTRVAESEKLLAQAQQDYRAAQLRKDKFDQSIPLTPQLCERALAPIRQAIIVQEKKIEELIKKRDIVILTAPFDGYINTLVCREGQTVVRGEPIMTVVKEKPEIITAWLPEKMIGRMDINRSIKVVSLSHPNQAFVSQISDISPSIEKLPKRLWKHPTVPEYGRSVIIPVQPQFACIHNELVGVKTILQ